MAKRLAAIFLAVAACSAGMAAARADTVIMKDGSIRQGTITRRTDTEIWLRIDWDGIRATVEIPKDNIEKVTIAPLPQAAAPAPATQPDNAASPPATAPAVRIPTLPESLTKLAINAPHPDEAANLPEPLATLWRDADHYDVLGDRAVTLNALRDLNDAFMQIPQGITWLNTICMHERKEMFSVWFARVHLDLATAKYRGGPFELKDVRDAERPALIGLLKEKTGPALEPLRSFFPPIDPKTNRLAPFTPQQLSSLGALNAIEIKDKAQYASAVLLAQLRLEPQMPMLDRVVLVNDLQTVRRILSRAIDLEPLARAAADKAAREKRVADEKARQEARRQMLYSSPR